MTCCNYQRCGLLDTILTLPKSGYYYGNITVEEAERMLKNEPNGAFLVRDSRDSSDSENRTDLYTITFKIQNKYGSVRVDYAKGYFSLSLQDSGLPLFRTMMDLVSFCYNRSVVEKLPVCVLTGHSRHQDVHLYLTKPVCRHKQMHSLMFLCREVVHKHVTRDNLDKLGLPKRLVELYISENPLFDEQLFPLYEEEDMDLDRSSEDSRSSGSRNSLQIDTGN